MNKNHKVLEEKGYPVFSTPQGLEQNDYFYEYSRGKVNQLSTVFDIDRTMRLYKADVDGKVTKTLLNEITMYMEQRIGYAMFLIDDVIYYLHKERIGRGKFAEKIMMIDLKDIPTMQSSIYDLYNSILEKSKEF